MPTITLEPKSHTYTDETGQRYTSVSSVLSRYKEPFDRDKIAAKIARRDGVTVDEVLDEWAKAAPYGSAVHEQMERFFLCDMGDFDLIRPYLPTLNKWAQQPVMFFPEKIVCDEALKIAGTADLVVQNSLKAYSILDWKTNNKIYKTAFGGKKLKGRLSHLDDCNYVHYSLQLNLYARMLGQPIQRLSIVHIPRGKDTLEVIPVPKMEKEVDIILEDFAKEKPRR